MSQPRVSLRSVGVNGRAEASESFLRMAANSPHCQLRSRTRLLLPNSDAILCLLTSTFAFTLYPHVRFSSYLPWWGRLLWITPLNAGPVSIPLLLFVDPKYTCSYYWHLSMAFFPNNDFVADITATFESIRQHEITTNSKFVAVKGPTRNFGCRTDSLVIVTNGMYSRPRGGNSRFVSTRFTCLLKNGYFYLTLYQIYPVLLHTHLHSSKQCIYLVTSREITR
jgi:hypothetical protein